jgi:hypothetical protein
MAVKRGASPVSSAAGQVRAERDRNGTLRANRERRPLTPGCLGDITNGMARSARSETKPRRARAPGTPVMVRLQPDQLADIDAWIATRTHRLTRPEAIRQLALTKARIDLDSGD